MVLLIDLCAFFTMLWVWRLVRRDQMYVGYAVIFVIVIGLGGLVLTFPIMLVPLSALSTLSQQSLGLIGLALAFVVLMLIYILSQLTLVSNRVIRLTQELAIKEALERGSPGAARPDGQAAATESAETGTPR